MITNAELEKEGFSYLSDTAEWGKDNIKISIHDGVVAFIREGENYHGLSVRIQHITCLNLFLGFLS